MSRFWVTRGTHVSWSQPLTVPWDRRVDRANVWSLGRPLSAPWQVPNIPSTKVQVQAQAKVSEGQEVLIKVIGKTIQWGNSKY